jgi:hypothetical protein
LIDVSNAVRKSLTWCTSHLPMHGRLNTFPTHIRMALRRALLIMIPKFLNFCSWLSAYKRRVLLPVIPEDRSRQKRHHPKHKPAWTAPAAIFTLDDEIPIQVVYVQDSDRRLNVDSKHKKLIAMPYLRPELDEWVILCIEVLFFSSFSPHVSSNLLVVL